MLKNKDTILKIIIHILIIIVLILSYALIEKNKQLKLSKEIMDAAVDSLNDSSKLIALNKEVEKLKRYTPPPKKENVIRDCMPNYTSLIKPSSKNNNTPRINNIFPEKYKVVAYHIGGIGTSIIDASAFDVSDYIVDIGNSYLHPSEYWAQHISLNSIRNLMHGMCNEGYKMIKCNNLNTNANSCIIELKEKYKNKMSFVCEKIYKNK